MAKTINLLFEGEQLIFTYKPIDRSVLYGKRRRIAFDQSGNECSKASLLTDGSILIRSGMAAQSYFTDESIWIPQGELEAINSDGSTPEKVQATIGVTVQAIEISASDVLGMRFTNNYLLSPETLPEPIKQKLDAGLILSFPFNPRSDYQLETGVLVSNENGYFALIGEPAHYKFLGLASIVSIIDEANSEDSDDLDFMLDLMLRSL